ncbi:MAG: glycosyltransferase family 2 protein [Sediminibacterium sp.]|jgi:poly-beta-1,6-N-acetyl-D-glucosamine synthase
MQSFFWVGLFVIFYTYLGYAIVLFILVKIVRLFRKKNTPSVVYELPTVTLIVAAYNEAYCIEKKITNTLALTYPKDKLTIVFITDGSTDETPTIVAKYPIIQLLHQPERTGKIVAVHRAMQTVSSEITVFTDANTLLNESALEKICQHYQDPKVGAVAGEKRVEIDNSGDATAGEGFYWKYESKLKAWDSELNMVIGAAGELFSIKTALYIPVPSDTILDDFMISMLIATNGYRIIYEPNAFALESASANTKEELKRKIRIAAGGIQSFLRLTSLLNPFKYPVLSFQYLSHRILRWTIAPVLMVLVFVFNWFLVFNDHLSGVFIFLLVAQNIFYSLALLGWILQSKSIKLKLFFIPYYFCMMNYAILAGIHRYFFSSQSVLWEKAKRK